MMQKLQYTVFQTTYVTYIFRRKIQKTRWSDLDDVEVESDDEDDDNDEAENHINIGPNFEVTRANTSTLKQIQQSMLLYS